MDQEIGHGVSSSVWYYVEVVPAFKTHSPIPGLSKPSKTTFFADLVVKEGIQADFTVYMGPKIENRVLTNLAANGMFFVLHA